MKTHPAIDVSIVIPVYRSAATLRDLTRQLITVLDGLKREYEIIFVDDGSTDNSWAILNNLRSEHPTVITSIQLMRNFGQHNALMCGFRQASGRYIVTMDDDLQHPPEEIPRLLHEIVNSDADVVYGVPDARKHRGWRNLGSFLVSVFYRMAFQAKVQPSAFRIVRREVIVSILSYSLNYTYIDGLLAWNTRRVAEVVVEHRPRAAGRSGYSLHKLVVLAFNLFTNFSLLPLQAVSLAGLLASLGGLTAGGYYLVRYLLADISVPGYASTIIAILVLGGLQLLALGVLGEYLGRVHLNINRKPQFTVRAMRRRRHGAGNNVSPHVDTARDTEGIAATAREGQDVQ